MNTTETINTTNHQNTNKADAKNVGGNERIASGVGGGLLAAYGLYRMDLIGLGIAALGGALVHRAAGGFCEVYSALGINTADAAAAGAKSKSHSNRVEKHITVNKPLEQIFEYWRNFENLPKIMSHLEAVTVIDNKRSHWKAKAPLGTSVEWDAEIISEQKNHFIAWRSVEGADVDNSGSVRFDRNPTGGGTQITITINFTPPAGVIGAAVASLFGENPDQQLEEDLKKFKQTMENNQAKAV